jgi:hypothetical protein
MKLSKLCPTLLLISCAETSTADLADSSVQIPPDAAADAGRDAGLFSDASTLADAAGLSDALVLDASTGDESIRGTALEGIQIIWPERVELCSEWREGRAIDDERADQTHLTLFQAVRPSLGSGDLGQARLPRGYLRSGTKSDQQLPLDPATIPAQLVRWDITKNASDTRLSASIEYDLGAHGVLTEDYGIYRGFGDMRPVDIEDQFYELTFTLRRPGGNEPAILTRCGGAENLEQAFQVLTTNNGTDTYTILRKLRTALAIAGSAPVHLQAAEIRAGGQNGREYFAHGAFAQTYAASHHNWVEESVIDLEKDALYYHYIYRSYEEGSPPFRDELTEIRMHNLDVGPEPPSIDLDFIQPDGSIRTDNTLVRAGWTRVDETALLRGQQQNCPAGASVATLDIGDYIFQLVQCPRATPPNFDLLAVVPVFFADDPSRAGVTIGSEGIEEISVQGAPAFRVTIGRNVAVVIPNGGIYEVDLVDDQGTSLVSFHAMSEPLDIPSRTHEQVARSEARDVELKFARGTLSEHPIGFSVEFAPVYFELSFGGRTYLVDAFDRMTYNNSHHNWDDSFEAKTEGLTLTWSDPYSDPGACFVRVTKDSDGSEILPETKLIYETRR